MNRPGAPLLGLAKSIYYLTWLNSSVKNAEVESQGYKISRLARENKVVGGVCTYTRVSLKTKVLKDLTSGFQQLWLQVQHNGNICSR